MNQTYVVNGISACNTDSTGSADYNNNSVMTIKKLQMKLRLSKLRERTQLLLQNDNWRKYFNSTHNDEFCDSIVLTPTNTSSSITHVTRSIINKLSYSDDDEEVDEIEEDFEYVCRNNENFKFTTANANKHNSLLLINNNSNSKLNSFKDAAAALVSTTAATAGAAITATNQENLLLTPIENYFLTTNSQLNLFNETPVMMIVNNDKRNTKKSQMDYYDTPCSTRKYHNKLQQQNNFDDSLLNVDTGKYVNLPQTPRSTPITNTKAVITEKKTNKLVKQTSVTFIGELASTSTPTTKEEEPITSTPNISTHNALNYHPSRTIRNKNKKLKRKLFLVESNPEVNNNKNNATEIDIKNLAKKRDLLKSKFNYNINELEAKIDAIYSKTTNKKSIKNPINCQNDEHLHEHRQHHQHCHHHHHHCHHCHCHHHRQLESQQLNADQKCYKCDKQNKYELKRLQQNLTPSKSLKKLLKKQQKPKNEKCRVSNIEFSLKDLFYTPNKMTQFLMQQQQQHQVIGKISNKKQHQNYYLKSDSPTLVNATPLIALNRIPSSTLANALCTTTSKIYYL